MTIYRLTEEDYTRILMFKRDLHMHPELSRKEVRTSAKIRDFLSTLPDFTSGFQDPAAGDGDRNRCGGADHRRAK